MATKTTLEVNIGLYTQIKRIRFPAIFNSSVIIQTFSLDSAHDNFRKEREHAFTDEFMKA